MHAEKSQYTPKYATPRRTYGLSTDAATCASVSPTSDNTFSFVFFSVALRPVSSCRVSRAYRTHFCLTPLLLAVGFFADGLAAPAVS